MADWSLPTLADLKVDVMSMLKGREVDAYTLAENPTNPPVGAKRYNHSLNIFQAWNGTAWVDLVIGITGGGTGATDINGFISNFNLGTMALQNSNNVAITGGYINGLNHTSGGWGLHVAGNTCLAGLVYAGAGPIAITNSAGKLIEASIDNIVNIAHINANETITGTWNFTQAISVGSYITAQQLSLISTLPQIWLNDTDGAADAKHFRIAHEGNQINFNFYSETLGAASTALYFNHVGYSTSVVGILAPDINLTCLRLAVRTINNTEARINIHGTGGNANGLFIYNQNDAAAAQFYAVNTSAYFKAGSFSFQSLAGANLTTIDPSGNLATPGQASVNHLVTSNNEAYYASGYSHVRIHISETSQPAGQQKFLIMNYAGNLSLIPSDDAGTNPVGADWAYSLLVKRDGRVRIGGGGLEVVKVHNSNHLMHGNWQPVDAGSIEGVTAIQFHMGHYMRVGTAVIVSGQFDASSGGVGVRCHARIFNPLYTFGNVPSGNPGQGAAGHGNVTSIDGEAGTCTAPAGAGHVDIIWISKAANLHAMHFHYMYIAAS